MRAVRGRNNVTSSGVDVRERLATEVLVCDGAMGTMLHAGGVSLDRSLPELNVSHGDLVRSIHRAYIAAGADVIETNTFGASRPRLARLRAGTAPYRFGLAATGLDASWNAGMTFSANVRMFFSASS